MRDEVLRDETLRNKVFISYRRADTAGVATMLRKEIANKLGDDAVFHDILGVNPGDDFPDKLRNQLDRARFTLALIGDGWMTTSDHYGRRRIDLETDWVRQELAYSLANEEVTVIPILIGPTVRLPTTEEDSVLPADLRGLLRLSTTRVSYDSLDHDVAPIVEQIATVLAPKEQAAPAAPPEPADRAERLETPASTSEPIAQSTTDKLSGFFYSNMNLFGMGGAGLALAAGLLWSIGTSRLILVAVLSYFFGALVGYGLSTGQDAESTI